MGILDGTEVVYVDRLESSQSLRLFTETGRRVPVHCTSSGKVLLAHLAEADREALLARLPLTALTPHTLSQTPRPCAPSARRSAAGAGPRPSTSARSASRRSRHPCATSPAP